MGGPSPAGTNPPRPAAAGPAPGQGGPAAKPARSNLFRKGLELEPLRLDGDDLGLGGRGSSGRFLGLCSSERIWRDLEESGIIKGLNALGFTSLDLRLGARDRALHELHLFHSSRSRSNLLIELRLKTAIWPAAPRYVKEPDLAGQPVIAVEWLAMQDPTQGFSPARPRLPGQDFPGLGMGRQFLELLTGWAREAGCAALFNVPEFYHNAAMYASSFRFLSPYMEGKLRRMQHDLQHEALAVTSYAILFDGLRDHRTNRPVPWQPQWQAKPISPSAAALFAGDAYGDKVDKAYRSYSYALEPAAVARARRLGSAVGPLPEAMTG